MMTTFLFYQKMMLFTDCGRWVKTDSWHEEDLH